VSLPVVSLLVFLALASAVGALALGARDLLFARGASGTVQTSPGAQRVRLRRIPHAANGQPAHGLVARFDRWFSRLVRETGLPLSAIEAALLLVFFGVALGGGAFVFSDHPMLATFAAAAGMGGTLGYLVIRRARHIRKLQEQLPTALDMLARGMRAGQSLDEAIDLIGRRSPEPLAAEFRYCAKQMAMGLSLPAVMRSLVDRACLFDVRIFTTTLTVHRKTGGNLAEVLERLAAVIRDRISYRRQLRAVTGAGRMSAVLIAAIGPCIFVYMFLFQSQYFRAMVDSPLGQSLLMTAVLLEVVGVIWTARLLKPMY
jgi:tight adherence protein B